MCRSEASRRHWAALCAIVLLLPVGGCQRDGRPAPGRLERSADRLERVAIGSDARLVLAGDPQPFDVAIPDRARLQVGFGVTDAAWSGGVEEVEFTASAQSAHGSFGLLRRRLRRPQAGQPNRWKDVTVPLAGLAGQQVAISLHSRVTRGSASSAGGMVWTNPHVVADRRVGGPNVILVSIDTLRADHLGCYGYGRDTSPRIDQMAREGVLFRHATAASSWTLPSHASLFTGLIPSRHGAVQFGLTTPLREELTTLPELLWDAGYDTAGFVGGAYVAAALGFAQGFDLYRDIGPFALTLARAPFTENVAAARRWMAKRLTAPFFVFLHTYQVHTPYAPPPPYDLMFDPGYDGPYRSQFTLEDRARLGPHPALEPSVLGHLQALYDGEIRQMDTAMGDLVDFLHTSGLAANTCVIFTADHGEEFDDHGDLFHDHAKLYDELIRVPLIVWGPPCAGAGRTVDEPVALVDVLPTLLTVAGLPARAQLDGQSFASALAGGSLPTGRFIYSEVDGSIAHTSGAAAAVRADDAKLIRSDVGGTHTEWLFDLREDPAERVNRIGSRPEIEARLGAALDALRPGGVVAGAPAATVAPDPAALERLRALGYQP